MTVFFYSIKWGQGKTTHAVGYARHCDATLLTNDLDTGTADIYESVLDRGIIQLEAGQTVKSAIDRLKGSNVVIDFGGFVESRVIEATKLANVTVVPLCYQSTADLTPAIKTMIALQPYAKNLVLLINNTKPEHVPQLQELLAGDFPDAHVLTVSPSRYISRLADDGLTVHDLAVLGGLEAYQLRNILPQIETLYALLDRYNRPIR